MSNFFATVKIFLAKAAVLAVMGLSAITGNHLLGSQLPTSPALIDTYLASGIASTDTSMTLANGATSDGITLSGYICFTIDVNTPQLEYACGTASGTAVTNMTRGIGFSNPNTTSTALAFPHRRLASVQSTDYPTLQLIVRQLTGIDTLSPNTVLSYDASVTTSSFSNSQQIPNVGYVNSVAVSGAPNGNTTTKGLYQEATRTQVASGTATGSTGADLTLSTRVSTTTGNNGTTSIVATLTDGTISPTFTSPTSTYTFGSIISASTTLSNATSGVLTTNASGSVSSIAPGTSGNVLTSNGASWVSTTSPPARFISPNAATTTVGGATTSTIATLTIPPASTNSVFLVNFLVTDNGGQNATTTFQIGGSNLFSCAGYQSGGGGQFMVSMDNATNKEMFSGYGFGGCTANNGTAAGTFDLSTTTTWKIFASTQSVTTLNGALYVYKF